MDSKNKKTIGDVLRARGVVDGSPEWANAAARILCGDTEWDRLSGLNAAQIEAELETARFGAS